ncbi:toll/interleukin-1 receptor domain-containing protein [Anaerorhabdus furcosa]|uniref:TIR domain-containing protein n=1 Tax=Anaerorhabdus furcosa TaxID=118967 RepID=A0A1T4M382_9FIRM|nr:toll/interleukin-1 receptor domain-containing protein [Anaerorhabdus furcosa]SJZ61449.1 TIR domain-containing protein [Anaerorhabdus furcosa]
MEYVSVGGIFITSNINKVFICFAAKDRYLIAQPIVYHLKNYGIDTWYDRYEMVMGDNREEKNIKEGVEKCKYAIIILSKFTMFSNCAVEEITILEKRYKKSEIVIFPILYELNPDNIPDQFKWLKSLIFKEVNKKSGTHEVCNHIACKITTDIKEKINAKSIDSILFSYKDLIPSLTFELLKTYTEIDADNLNSRITILYVIYLSLCVELSENNSTISLISSIFQRLFSETKLNLPIDYREIWLLENSICILIEYYRLFCTESKI